MGTPPGPELKNIMAKTELVMEVGKVKIILFKD